MDIGAKRVRNYEHSFVLATVNRSVGILDPVGHLSTICVRTVQQRHLPLAMHFGACELSVVRHAAAKPASRHIVQACRCL